MSTKSFTNTYKVTTKYGIKNLIKAVNDKSSHLSRNNVKDYSKDYASAEFVESFINNNSSN